MTSAAPPRPLEKRASTVSSMKDLWERLSRGELVLEEEKESHSSAAKEKAPSGFGAIVDKARKELPKTDYVPAAFPTGTGTGPGTPGRTAPATPSAAPAHSRSSDLVPDPPMGVKLPEPVLHTPSKLLASPSKAARERPPATLSTNAIEVKTAITGSLKKGAHFIKPTCIQVVPEVGHAQQADRSSSSKDEGFNDKPSHSKPESDRDRVFKAQFAMLAQLEDEWDEEAEAEIEEERRALAEAEAAAAAARARRESALKQVEDAKKQAEEAKRAQAEESAKQMRAKQEGAAEKAKRTEEARARAREAARKVGRDLFHASGGSLPALSETSPSKNDESAPEISRTSSMRMRTISMRKTASAAAVQAKAAAAAGGAHLSRVRQKSAPAFAQVSAVGHQAFGFALGMRDGHRKTLSFSLLREDTPAPTTKNGKADPNAKKAPMKINCPCTACGHLTTAIIDDDKINRGAEGEKNQVSVRFKCESCGADLAVKVTKRDPKLSI